MILSKNSNTIAALTFCLVTAAIQMFALYNNKCLKQQTRFAWIEMYLNVEKRCACYVGDRRADLLSCMNYVHTKRINCVPTNIVPVHAGDQHLSLVVVHKQPPDHCADPLLPSYITEIRKKLVRLKKIVLT